MEAAGYRLRGPVVGFEGGLVYYLDVVSGSLNRIVHPLFFLLQLFSVDSLNLFSWSFVPPDPAVRKDIDMHFLCDFLVDCLE